MQLTAPNAKIEASLEAVSEATKIIESEGKKTD